jgi:WD40-like Beta Propeller Repeat
MKAMWPVQLIACALLLAMGASCSPSTPMPQPIPRAQFIPAGAVKMHPQDDAWPPIAASGWSDPEPMPGPINTAGAEDSPYPTHDGRSFLFVFAPDLNVPAQEQLFNGATGIWSAAANGESWGEPTRVWLAKPDEPALDGCPFALSDVLYFCSVRVGNVREIDIYRATMRDGLWSDWKNAGQPLNIDLEAGELHMNESGTEVLFASRRAGGYGGFDLWTSQATAQGWSAPVNLGPAINTPGDENRPALTPDESELWFDGPSRIGMPGPAIFRSQRLPDGSWGESQEIVSRFAGEPAFSADGQVLYFVHHYFSPDMSRMIEADIYMTHLVFPSSSP